MKSASDRSSEGVSFVVPVYNKAPYLPGVLGAIEAQRGDFARQYVFVDDGSSDDSLAIVRRLTKDWPDTVIESQPNQGSAHATNRGIALARREFIKFVDADDLLAHDATDRLLRALRDSDACLAFGGVVRFEKADGFDLAAPLPDEPKVERLTDPLALALRNSLFNPSQFLARRECVTAVGGCDESIVYSQEYSLTLRLAGRWDFLRLDAPVAYLPVSAPGRISDDNARQLQRVTLACAAYLRPPPDTPPALVRLACRRASGRAWLFARRTLGAGIGSRWWRAFIRSRLGLVRRPVEFIERCAEVHHRPTEAEKSRSA
ncbi:MAG: glycosyltransferase family 2 protein [Alphaproteobacteria bacterium]